MKHTASLVMLSIGLGSLVGCTPRMDSSSIEEMAADADALDASFVAAFNSGDVDAMNDLYWNSPDVVVFPPDALQARGFAAVANANAGMLGAMAGAKLELIEQHQIPAGDVVIGWGLWRITIPAANGATTELVGRYTDVKGQRDGKWVYLIDHASAPLPSESP
jgi:ketosteroid isomerase-like protein